jgi:membrane glycosyltransferase
MGSYFRRRVLYCALVAATTTAMSLRLWSILRIDGMSGLKTALLVLFAVLTAWVTLSFWLAAFGAYARWRGRKPDSLSPAADPVDGRSATRVAVVMPIYNEDVVRCFAGLRAVQDSVARAGASQQFDFYVLSDSTDQRCWVAEELEWCRLRASTGADAPLYYRHRSKNIARKSGNVADFCRNWGSPYAYLVVLDADSLMSGQTLLRMKGLMDANPRTALIQAPPRLVGRQTLFARLQQFASSVYGPLSEAGFAFVYGPAGNYWGHNAMLRMSAFLAHCGLPELPGRAPLGGQILSHDFVEAALLRRAGWDLWLMPELGGTYEEVPPTIVDYLKRDLRWCQGNVQHLRLILARGFKLSSRIHFATGAMAYLASPLWLLLLIVSASEAHLMSGEGQVTYMGRYPVLSWPGSHALALGVLLLLTVGMLYGQRVLAVLTRLNDADFCRAHGGRLRFMASAVAECAVSTLMAPVFMLTHSWFVVRILLGLSVGWDTQQRRERTLALSSAAGVFLPHTAFGATSAVAIFQCVPHGSYWFIPLLLGLALSIPLALLTSSVAAGLASKARGLFLIPSETHGLPLLTRANALNTEDHCGQL